MCVCVFKEMRRRIKKAKRKRFVNLSLCAEKGYLPVMKGGNLAEISATGSASCLAIAVPAQMSTAVKTGSCREKPPHTAATATTAQEHTAVAICMMHGRKEGRRVKLVH